MEGDALSTGVTRSYPTSAAVVICGAGIAGAACAYFLAHRAGVGAVVLVEEGAPLSLTSDKSTECYRNWWPGPGADVVQFMNHSIDLLEDLTAESDNRFLMNRRGYLFASADPARIPEFINAAQEGAASGVGELRQHPGSGGVYEPHALEGIESKLDGCDLITDTSLIREHFPYLSSDTVAVLHVRRCGWLSAQQLGAYYLERAREAGAVVVTGRVERVVTDEGVRAVQVATEQGPLTIQTPTFVNAAGPFAKEVGAMAGVDLPLVCEGHVKVSIDDVHAACGRDAPLIIWTDAVELPWRNDERAALAVDDETAYLAAPFAPGVHGRPTGGGDARSLLLYWTYDIHVGEPVFPMEWDPHYPEIVLRGMSRMLPALSRYFDNLPRPFVDGGYYTRTEENRPLIGPTSVEGYFLCNGFSGFGIMASAAAGELLAAYVTGEDVPHYACAFLLARYDDVQYRELLENWPETGQL
jgi:glycine/D-amino acid oxidase-like deaminating enzyme